MSVTAQTIRDRLPEFCNASDGDVDTALAEAECKLNRTQWGDDRADEATIALTGHFLRLSLDAQAGKTTGAGPVTSESEGGLSVSYAVSSDVTSSFYGTTIYGRKYLELKRLAFPERFRYCNCTIL